MRSRIEEKLLLYSQLSPAERVEVEQYVAHHPALNARLEEARAFDTLLREARLLKEDPPGDEALAYYAATRRLGSHPLPATLQEPFDRIEARLEADPALRARYAEMVRRLDALETASDPVAQFEHLTGHALAPPRPQPAPVHRLHRDGRPRLYLLFQRFGRQAVAAAVAILAVCGTLIVASHLSQSELDRLAAFDDATFEAEGLQMRGGTEIPDVASSDQLYARALPLLREARTHTLGLFPRYDQATLTEAAGLLYRIVEQEANASPLRAEAYYLLAKIHLAQDDPASATAALQQVLAGPGLRVQEAQALLHALETLSEK